jgi:UDP-2,3-diacylglucosamine hydrolase
MQQKDPHDYYIFGHRHLPFSLPIERGTYFNLGEWFHYQTFMKIDSEIPQYFTWDGHSASSYDPPYGKGK